jgi:hypothetical protein
MFIVKFDGGAPEDKAEWIAILREALAGELGAYRVRLYRAEKGWRFKLEWRPEPDAPAPPPAADGPAAAALNVYRLLERRGKPVDPTWRP